MINQKVYVPPVKRPWSSVQAYVLVEEKLKGLTGPAHAFNRGYVYANAAIRQLNVTDVLDSSCTFAVDVLRKASQEFVQAAGYHSTEGSRVKPGKERHAESRKTKFIASRLTASCSASGFSWAFS